ncbi:energy transducer TonB [Altererythrobacter sp. GH1-8]|uniref:energy transducer TonB n=1 Tax=Altererythrobacter sp. GH1-8 TaxID=3349333 RepID=UPI00374D1876
MQAIAANREERIGLSVALGLHLLLVLAFLIQPGRGEVMPLPERMTVSLATDVGLEATAPAIVPESRAAIAPELGDEVTPPAPQDVPDVRRAADTPQTPSRTTTRVQPVRSETTPQRSTGSRLGDNFLPGAGDSTASDDARIPASQIGASAQASIVQAISRQIKPHWNAPSGVDVDQLVTVLAFELNEDGSLKGRPRVISQSGETAANLPQKNLHAERAIRAVQLAAPFDLPPEYYNAWKSVRGARFDRNLSR